MHRDNKVIKSYYLLKNNWNLIPDLLKNNDELLFLQKLDKNN